MTILSKGGKPDQFEPHSFLKLSFMNNQVFRSNFVESESFLESNSPGIPALCETNLDNLIDSILASYVQGVIFFSSERILLLICMVLQFI